MAGQHEGRPSRAANAQNSLTPIIPGPSTAGKPVLLAEDALQWVRQLHRHTGGYVQVCSAGTVTDPRADDWPGVVVDLAESGRARDDLSLYLERRDRLGATGLYLRQTSMTRRPERGERGTVADTLALPAFWMDGDTNSPAHKHVACEGGEACDHERKHARRTWPLPADADAVWAIVAEAGYPAPSVVQDSGNGVNGFWMLDEPRVCTPAKTGPEAALSDRFHQQLREAAKRISLHYGPLADIARVMRMPGTVNRKPGTPGGARMSQILSVTDRRFTWAEMASMVEQAEARTEAAKPKPQAAKGLHQMQTLADLGPADLGPARPKLEQDNSPQDDFNRRAEWLADILEPAGWRLHSTVGTELRITRPGKDVADGHSATIRHSAADTMHVFSSDASPFEADTNYTKAGAWRELHHGGEAGDPNWALTTKDLRRMGYGDPLDRERGFSSTDTPGGPSLVDLIDDDFPAFLDRMGRLLADDNGKAPSYPEYVFKAYLRHKADAKAKEKLREELTGDDVGKLAASVFDRSKLADLPRPEQLIDGILTREAYTVLSGQSQAMKSFLALAWAASVATGRSWLGRHKAARGTVVYIAAEGASGIHERLRAWEVANNGGREIEPDRLHIVTQAVQLGNAAHVHWLVDFATGVGADLVVVDTLRRCTAGLDEDSNTQMSPVLTGVSEQLRQACAATTLFVHHTGHAGERSRGASCIENDADAVWKIARVGTSDERKLEQPKSKDTARVEHMSLVFQPVRGTESGHLTTGFGDGLWNYVNGFPGGVTVSDLQAYWGMDKRDSARTKANRCCDTGVLIKHDDGRNVTYTANPAAKPNQRPQNGRGEDGLGGFGE